MPFLFFWGRAPTLFWVGFMGTCFSLGCALAPRFEVYYAMKALQGFTITAGQTSGLAYIQDMFFFHEQARKIGIWTAVFLVSPYFGPLFANFILTGTESWQNVAWLVFAIGCLNIVTNICFLDETWYRRDIEIDAQPKRGLRISRVFGIWQIQVHREYFGTFLVSCQRLLAVLFKPIMLPTMIY
jgi:MFS family permease